MATLACPVCESTLVDPVWWSLPDVKAPRHELYVCSSCREVVHLLSNGSVQLLGDLLEKDELGDDRVRGAISKPRISTVRSFLDVFDNVSRAFRMDLAEASGHLHMVLAQIENRIDFAISVFAGLDMVWDRAEDGLSSLRSARDLVSTLSARSRSARRETSDDSSGSSGSSE